MIDIFTFSVYQFKKIMLDNKLYDDNIETFNQLAIISIGDTQKSDTEDLWSNGCNNHFFKSNHFNVLNINFDDISKNEYDKIVNNYKNNNLNIKNIKVNYFNNIDAINIINFIKNNKNKLKFIVHCSAGISRSGAISYFIYDYLKSLGILAKIKNKNLLEPNYYIYNLLKDNYNNKEKLFI